MISHMANPNWKPGMQMPAGFKYVNYYPRQPFLMCMRCRAGTWAGNAAHIGLLQKLVAEKPKVKSTEFPPFPPFKGSQTVICWTCGMALTFEGEKVADGPGALAFEASPDHSCAAYWVEPLAEGVTFELPNETRQSETSTSNEFNTKLSQMEKIVVMEREARKRAGEDEELLDELMTVVDAERKKLLTGE